MVPGVYTELRKSQSIFSSIAAAPLRLLTTLKVVSVIMSPMGKMAAQHGKDKKSFPSTKFCLEILALSGQFVLHFCLPERGNPLCSTISTVLGDGFPHDNPTVQQVRSRGGQKPEERDPFPEQTAMRPVGLQLWDIGPSLLKTS